MGGIGRVVAGVVALAAPVVVAGSTAEAFERMKTTSCTVGMEFETPDVELVVHVGELDGTASDEADMVAAIGDVVDQFNLTGGTPAEVATVTTTTDPFVFGTWFNETSPTIHVGFEPGLPNPSGRTTYGPRVNPNNGVDPCTYDEAHIAFKDMPTASWNFGTPGGAGSASPDWYLAGHLDAAGDEYFRITFLHELLHAFGIDHATNSYSFTNYYTKAWANRDPAAMIRPLPDDAQALRTLYPTGPLRYELGLFNSWFVPGTAEHLPAEHETLCAPSRGRSPDTIFAEHCGQGGATGGSTVVCQGDRVVARFTIANYSTATMDVVVQLFTSVDAYQSPDDAAFGDWDVSEIEAGRSAVFELAWPAPALTSGTEYHVIADVVGYEHVAGVPSGSTVTSDWLPLSGTITGC